MLLADGEMRYLAISKVFIGIFNMIRNLSDDWFA